jgi:serine/threonine-protein kinase
MHGAQRGSPENGAPALADLLGPTARYRALKLLGRGGMGEVYEAEHVALGSRVVVKIIRADRANAQSVERMRLEAQALARLAHPNLVRVTDFDVTPTGQPFFVMELLEGRSLGAELASRKRLGIAEALDITTQALEGLALAHDAGVVHRDIKPDNVFLCPSKQPGRFHVKVLDFGIAKLVAGGNDTAAPIAAPIAAPTAPGRLLGTPRYVAPEQAAARPLDARVDIYAMGLLLYEMLTGRGPFEDATTTVELIRAHLNRTPEPPSRYLPGLAPVLDRIVLRCLEKRPEDRYAKSRDLLTALYEAWRSTHAALTAAPAAPAAATAAEDATLERTIVVPEAETTRPVAPAVAAPAATPAWQPAAPALQVPATPLAPQTARQGERRELRLPLAAAIVVVALSAILSSLATHFLYR